MQLLFSEPDHKYFNPDAPDDNWTSVTSVIHSLAEEFIPQPAAEKANKNRKSKWYKVSVTEILKAWEDENLRSRELGHFYHNMREQELLNSKDNKLPVVPSVITDGLKRCPEQKLQEGIYPEHMTYLTSVNIIGQSDLVTVEDGYIHIDDYKTCKEIKRASYVSWDGDSKKMLGPVAHIEDCNFNHYALQLSIYAFAIQRHNPNLRVGELTLEHVLFEQEGENQYGYPIYSKDENDQYIVQDVVKYKLPYMKSEVLAIINHMKNQKK